MIPIDDCFNIGAIVGKYSYKGEVLVRIDSDNPEIFEEVESVFIQSGNELIPYFIEKCRLHKPNTYRVQFEDVDSELKADRLLRSALYLPLDLLPDLEEDEFYYHEIIGYQVQDLKKGAIGKITGINDSGAQDVFEIEFQGKTILVPVVENFISELNKEKGILILDTPDGLIDLFLE